MSTSFARNLAAVALAAAVALMGAAPVLAAREAAPLPDATIQTYLEHRLMGRHLEGVIPRVESGVVTLDGHVDNLLQKTEAARLAQDVEGVVAVRNDLTVPAGDNSSIRRDLQKMLNNYAFYGVFDWIEAVPEGSRVVLTGWVYEPWHKESIARRAAAVPGVTQVDDQIEVLPVSSFDDLLRYQAARLIYGDLAFLQYADSPNPPIHILVRNGRVSLEGVVPNEVERRLAETLVRTGTSAFGVVNGLRTSREIAS